MGDLRLSTDSSEPAILHAGIGSQVMRPWRALRSSAFFLTYFLYLLAIVGLGQRLLVWPAVLLLPRRRRAIMGGWLRAHARATLAMARALANVRVSARGAVAPESCIVLMNHQSVLDIPLGLASVPGPCPVIPTRDRYKWGIPGVSPLSRMAGFPFVSQKRVLSRAELTALTRTAELVARGELSLIIFPEGHRSRDGGIGRFMRSGLRIVFAQAKRPVYCIVADGMVETRTFADAMLRFADTTVRAVILGPFSPPDEASIDDFIDTMHARMSAALEQLRSTSSSSHHAASVVGPSHPC
jgi:1-acyl-sn-glycerol-3-phosphate acyltransferase